MVVDAVDVVRAAKHILMPRQWQIKVTQYECSNQVIFIDSLEVFFLTALAGFVIFAAF